MKPARFHPSADDELAEAIAYYAQKSQALGERFYHEIRRMTAEIEASPQRHPLWKHGTRRILGKHFPYALIYVEQTECLHVLAVAHCKRRPHYWHKSQS